MTCSSSCTTAPAEVPDRRRRARRVARTLGDALERLGAPAAYGDLCRAPETIDLLRLWGSTPTRPLRVSPRSPTRPASSRPTSRSSAGRASWVLPRRRRGRRRRSRSSARWNPMTSGRQRRSCGRCWPRPTRTAITPAACSPYRPSASTAGRAGGPRRGARCWSLVDDLLDVQLPDSPADDVLDWLLDEARAGLALTERGALSRALCVEIARRRPDWTWGKPPRSEADVGNLASLHAALRGSGLVRRRGREFFATKRAGALSPGARRLHLLERLLDGDSFQAAVAELTFAALLQDGLDVRKRVAEVIDEAGWRSDGGPLPLYAVPSTVTEPSASCSPSAPPRAVRLHRDRPGSPSRAGLVLCALRARRSALNIAAAPPARRRRPPSASSASASPYRRYLAARRHIWTRATKTTSRSSSTSRTRSSGRARRRLGRVPDRRRARQCTATPARASSGRRAAALRRSARGLGRVPGAARAGVDPHEAQHAIGQRFVEELMEQFGPPPTPHPRHARGDRRTRRKAQRAARRGNRR